MNSLLVISFLNELELICVHTSIAIISTVKRFQLLLSNTNNSISIICLQIVKWLLVSLFNSN